MVMESQARHVVCCTHVMNHCIKPYAISDDTAFAFSKFSRIFFSHERNNNVALKRGWWSTCETKHLSVWLHGWRIRDYLWRHQKELAYSFLDNPRFVDARISPSAQKIADMSVIETSAIWNDGASLAESGNFQGAVTKFIALQRQNDSLSSRNHLWKKSV